MPVQVSGNITTSLKSDIAVATRKMEPMQVAVSEVRTAQQTQQQVLNSLDARQRAAEEQQQTLLSRVVTLEARPPPQAERIGWGQAAQETIQPTFIQVRGGNQLQAGLRRGLREG